MYEDVLGNLNRIIQYCEEAAEARERFGGMDALRQDAVYRNASFFCVYQAGGLAKRVHFVIQDAYSQVPWKELGEMHRLGEPDPEKLWSALTEWLPVLRGACEKIIGRMEALEQEGAAKEPGSGMRMT